MTKIKTKRMYSEIPTKKQGWIQEDWNYKRNKNKIKN